MRQGGQEPGSHFIHGDSGLLVKMRFRQPPESLHFWLYSLSRPLIWSVCVPLILFHVSACGLLQRYAEDRGPDGVAMAKLGRTVGQSTRCSAVKSTISATKR